MEGLVFILVVSDVHLGYEGCNKEAFSKFLDQCESIEIEHLVLFLGFLLLW